MCRQIISIITMERNNILELDTKHVVLSVKDEKQAVDVFQVLYAQKNLSDKYYDIRFYVMIIAVTHCCRQANQ